MANDSGQKEAEKETQQELVPSSEQKTAESDVAAREASQEGLPEGAKERTKQEFEKLRAKLRKEREEKAYYERLFQSLNAGQQKQSEPEPLVDPNTGLINEQVFAKQQQEVQQAKKEAQTARQEAREFRDQIEKNDAYKEFPNLNPDTETFDPNLHKLTRQILTDSMLYPGEYGNRRLSMKNAAQEASKLLKKEEKKVDTVTPKEQAALEAIGGTNPKLRKDSADLIDLKHRTRKGDDRAIYKRLENLYGKKS